MTDSVAVSSQGSKVQHGVSSTFTDLEEVTDIKLGGVSASAIDVTHLGSNSKEFIAGIKNNGTVDISCNFVNGTVQAAVRADMNSRTKSPYKVVMPSQGSTTFTVAFNAIVTKYAGPEAKVDSKLEIQITLQISGDITITSA